MPVLLHNPRLISQPNKRHPAQHESPTDAKRPPAHARRYYLRKRARAQRGSSIEPMPLQEPQPRAGAATSAYELGTVTCIRHQKP